MAVFDLVSEITESFGARPATSSTEHDFSQWFASQCCNYGLEVEEQTFNTVRSPGFALGLLYVLPTAIVIFSRFVPFPFLRWVLVALLVVNVVLLALQLQGRGILDGIARKGPSQNIIARYTPTSYNERMRKIVFVAHVDTPVVSPLNTESTASLHRRLTNWSFYYLVVAVVVLAFLACGFAWMETAELWVWLGLAIGSAVPMILGLDALLMPILNTQSLGANDSASGIASLLGVIDNIAQEHGGQLGQGDTKCHETFGTDGDEALQQSSDLAAPEDDDWLGLGGDFDARSAGKDIGTWDNFETSAFEAIRPEQSATEQRPVRRAESRPTAQPVRAMSSTLTSPNIEGSSKAFTAAFDGKEVWFVATGARHANATGMRAFLNTFSPELRDALIVNLESVGFGDLHWYEREAAPLSVSISSRIVSLSKRAARELELRISGARMTSGVTAATPALFKHHKAGTITRLVSTGFPEAYRATDDNAEACTPEALDETVAFLLEFLAQA